MSLNFGKINRAASFNPTSAFPLDARSYFESYNDALKAAQSAKAAGSSESIYFHGQTIAVVENSIAKLYIIQTNGTLKEVGNTDYVIISEPPTGDGCYPVSINNTNASGISFAKGDGTSIEFPNYSKGMFVSSGTNDATLTVIAPSGLTYTAFRNSGSWTAARIQLDSSNYTDYTLPKTTSLNDYIHKMGLVFTIVVEGDKNTFYPVRIPITSDKTLPTFVSIYKDLGTQTPSGLDGSHEGGTSSLWLMYECRNNCWDGNGGYIKTLYKYENYAKLCADVWMTGSSCGDLVVWLRGGGCLYNIAKTADDRAPTIYYETSDIGSYGHRVEVEPRTDIGNGGIGSTTYLGYGDIKGNATSANSVNITGSNKISFNGSDDTGGCYTDSYGNLYAQDKESKTFNLFSYDDHTNPKVSINWQTGYTTVNGNISANNFYGSLYGTATKAANATEATKAQNATKDQNGNIIHETYLTKSNFDSERVGKKCSYNTTAYNNGAEIFNDYTNIAERPYSTAMGQGTWAWKSFQTVTGSFNKHVTPPNNTGQEIFTVGNGTSSGNRGNAAYLTDYGYLYLSGSTASIGQDYAEYFEWLDGNPNNEDRRGYFVTLDGNKIRIAKSDEYVLGVISGQPTVIGNNDIEWQGRYLRDEFGSFILEDYSYDEEVVDPESGDTKIVTKTSKRRKENPEYDPEREHLGRGDRPEWGIVGMMGVLAVRDDGTCKVNGFCKVAEGGIATASDTGYRVIARVNENIVKVVLK
jgi:hypothetical protein